MQQAVMHETISERQGLTSWEELLGDVLYRRCLLWHLRVAFQWPQDSTSARLLFLILLRQDYSLTHALRSMR